jgi:hypothetical protein
MGSLFGKLGVYRSGRFNRLFALRAIGKNQLLESFKLAMIFIVPKP